ncbi:MAG: glutathione S-transferase family protein [Thermodesulfobacteriota bacterium]
MDLALYHYDHSVCSQKVRLCLEEKGLAWASHPVDLMRFENTRPEYLALNPEGVVPTLVHDGRPIRESTVINEYLDDVFPEPPLRPAGALARAEMRVWIKLEDDTALPSVGLLTFQRLIKPQMRQRSEGEIADMMAAHPNRERARLHRFVRDADLPAEVLRDAERKLVGVLDRLEASLASQPWLAGATYSLADLTWLPFLDRMVLLGMGDMLAPAARPALADWCARSRERPSYARAVLRFMGGRSRAEER